MTITRILRVAPLVFCLLPALGAAQAPAGIDVPGDYVIGVEDVLGVVFWREQDKNLTTDVVVRPDGKISVPMLNDIKAAGLTPEQLAASVQQAASKYIRDAAATVVVREIHSRKIFVIGEVNKPGTLQIGSELNVLQAIAEAGGFLEHAKKSNVVVVRNEGGREQRFKFNYKDVVAGKKLEQNIKLRPGDTVLVR
jgi:polysaccharide biosynthesis/export protein